MYDATGASSHVLVGKVQPNDLIAIYLTGSGGIPWGTADVAQFTSHPTPNWVRIDQGGAGAPQYEANVMDVEQFAYSLSAIANWESKCTAPRPTAYVNGSEKLAALGDSPDDIWLAEPGISDAEAMAIMAANPRIVAVQNLWTTNYDRSVVGDPYWPAKKPVVIPPPTKGKTMVSISVPVPIGPGDIGNTVRAVQALAGAKRGHTLAIDGVYGLDTMTAVKGVQAVDGLHQTGIVDAATWEALIS